jgi:hypothetical protein
VCFFIPCYWSYVVLHWKFVLILELNPTCTHKILLCTRYCSDAPVPFCLDVWWPVVKSENLIFWLLKIDHGSFPYDNGKHVVKYLFSLYLHILCVREHERWYCGVDVWIQHDAVYHGYNWWGEATQTWSNSLN